jgi:hypothetical protein
MQVGNRPYLFQENHMKRPIVPLVSALASAYAAMAFAATSAPADRTPPTINAFTIPASANTVKIPIMSLSASDNTAVTAYQVTQNLTPPSSQAKGWSALKPSSVTVSGSGLITLYAWAKDKAGNVSRPASALVNVDAQAPVVNQFGIPTQVAGSPIPVTQLVATDNTAVSAYFIGESKTPPTLNAQGWANTLPTSYSTAKTGPLTLYAWARDAAGNVSAGKSASTNIASHPSGPAFNLQQTLSDGAQRTTLAFSGLALITGNLEAQSFFPPGKVADYTGFQYLRDNDPDNMGHNTSFLTRIANNVLYVLNDAQLAQLKNLAVAQLDLINLYGYKRYPLMQAFRRLIDGDIPSGSLGLDLKAVQQASRDLYLIDGQISYDRAALYADILNSLDPSQRAYLDAMKGKGWNSWPNISDQQIRSKMQGLPQGTAVAVMTYASDLFSWYAGSIEADVYFCPERHGTYYGGFYIKDAPAIGHEGYGIDEQLTASAGAVLSDTSKGYVSAAQAALVAGLVDVQRDNLYASESDNIVDVRTEIATALRSLLNPATRRDTVRAQVLALSEIYGELDGANNYAYAATFAQLNKTLSDYQKSRLVELRKSILSGTYADGTAFNFSVSSTPYLYAQPITDSNLLAPYIADTDAFFLP